MDKPISRQHALFDEVVAGLKDPAIEKLVFTDRVFEDHQEIRALTFTKTVEFVSVDFKGGLTLYLCEFEKVLLVDAVSFGGGRADFGDCTFGDSAVFRPKFASLLSLRSGVFAKGFTIAPPRDREVDMPLHPMEIDLRLVRISGEAIVSVLDFREPSFEGRTNAGPVQAHDLTLEKDARLVLSGFNTPLLNLRDLVLADKASMGIKDVHADAFYFMDVQTRGTTTISFDRIKLTKAWFEGSSVEKIVISNAIWPSEEQRLSIYEETELRERLASAGSSRAEVEATTVARERVAATYRQLVLNYEASRNYEVAEQFHFGEMEMMRLGATLSTPAVFGRLRPYLNTFWLYRALSIYGTSYRRATLVLLGLLVLFTAIFMFNGLQDPKTGAVVDYDLALPSAPLSRQPLLPFDEFSADSGRAFVTVLSIATLQKDKPMQPAGIGGAFWATLLQILAPAQATLLVFSLRRRFRRASI